MRIFGFDPFEAKVEDITITIIHVSFFFKNNNMVEDQGKV